MASIKEIVEKVVAEHGDSRIGVSTDLHVNEQTGVKHDHYFLKVGEETLYKIIVPRPPRGACMIEEYHEDPNVVHGHPVTKMFLLAPTLAALLKESKETKAILERVSQV